MGEHLDAAASALPTRRGLDTCQLGNAETVLQPCPTRARDVPASHAVPRSCRQSPNLAATLIREVIFYGGSASNTIGVLSRVETPTPSHSRPRSLGSDLGASRVSVHHPRGAKMNWWRNGTGVREASCGRDALAR